MAQTNNTPASFWLSLPLRELVRWIKESNQLAVEARRRQEEARARARAKR